MHQNEGSDSPDLRISKSGKRRFSPSGCHLGVIVEHFNDFALGLAKSSIEGHGKSALARQANTVEFWEFGSHLRCDTGGRVIVDDDDFNFAGACSSMDCKQARSKSDLL